MIPPAFDYYRATDVPDALDLLATHADADPVVLAGGQGLLPDAKTGEASPEVVVDVSEIDSLRGVEDDGRDTVSVGALTTHATLAESDAVEAAAPVLADAAGEVGDVQVRNRGTIGGNLAEADPAADLPAAVVAADATLVACGQEGKREVPAAEFFRGEGATALDDGELLTEIRLPRGPSDADAATAGGAYAKKTHPASGYALVGVAASFAVRNGTVTDARVAASGVADAPVRLTGVEVALVECGTDANPELVGEAADRAGAGLDPAEMRSDAAASGEFRRHLLSTYAERALQDALGRTAVGGTEPHTAKRGRSGGEDR